MLLPSAALAAAPAPPTCTGAHHRELDFWLGDWNARWQGGAGSNRITRSYDGCVIEERFDGAPGMHLKGHSISAYFARTGDWRQTWVDNEDGYIPLAGGPDGRGRFVLTALPATKTLARNRMVFEDIRRDSFTWRWQKSATGRDWSDDWVIRYTRKH
jgi:hypothetical protein